MKAKQRSGWIRVITWSTLFLTSLSTSNGQTQINLGTQGRNVDFTNAPYTKPIRSGSSLPSQCSAGEFFLNTGATAGQNLFACLGTTWTAMAATTGLPDPGANGLVKRTALNATTAVAAPNGTIVGTTDVQTLTGKSIDASEINSGVFNAARMPALTGDLTSASGSTATALTTVLQTPGSFGDANHTLQISVDSKGRILSLSALPIVTGLTSAFYQQLSKAGTISTQRPTLNFSNAFTVSDNPGASRTDVDLAAVNTTTGTFGSANQIPVITVNSYGQITAVTTVSGGGTNNVTNSSTITSGTLSAIPASCTTGALYFSTDQPQGQQIYVCSASNTWSPSLAVGNSGALAFNNGSLDIVSSVVPRLTAANHFTGSNQLDGTTTLSNVNITGACTGCNSSGFANPMTTLGDQIVGGSNGVAMRASVGAPGQIWTVSNAGQPVWASPTASGTTDVYGSSVNYPALSEAINFGGEQITLTSASAIQFTLTGSGSETNQFFQNTNTSTTQFARVQVTNSGVVNLGAGSSLQNIVHFDPTVTGTPLVGTQSGWQVNTSGLTQPACDATHRGLFWPVFAATGTADVLQFCAQTTSGFAWKGISLQ